MKTNTGRIAILIIGIIVVAVSIVVFATRSISEIPVYQVAFGFLLLAEVVLFAGLIFNASKENSGDRIISASGITIVSIVYLIATVILSIFAKSFTESIKNYVVLEIVIAAICAVICILIVAFSKRAAVGDESLKDGEAHKSDTPKRGGF